MVIRISYIYGTASPTNNANFVVAAGAAGVCIDRAESSPGTQQEAVPNPDASKAPPKAYRPSVQSEDPDAKFARLMGASHATDSTPLASEAPNGSAPQRKKPEMLLLDLESISIALSVPPSGVLLLGDAARDGPERVLCIQELNPENWSVSGAERVAAKARQQCKLSGHRSPWPEAGDTRGQDAGDPRVATSVVLGVSTHCQVFAWVTEQFEVRIVL
jgi:hypothetical protein